ncbi:hypothetical protein H1S01_19105 [Heliobacterium chlorum]|uniref:Uncharacterized protein n=1 Tax=Heliobacterium chlorum TaxID=2698 RepID=A0ABR7T9K1_HELCL|nr:hypothetical protein [Heliobacterium chlorum]MBC9786566.1 hypothetical protein [Heliobacterium chlorum]
MTEFYQTLMGRKFFERDVPKLSESLATIAEQLARLNQNIEKLNENMSKPKKAE